MDFKSIKDKINKKGITYKKVFESDEGKYVLNDIYKFCRITHPSYVEGSSHKTAFNEGAKSFAHYIKGVLKQSPTDIDALIEEYSKSNNYNVLKRSK
jgi:hypothetical protein